MYNHAAENYVCPICLGVQGRENDQTMIKQDDIFFKDDLVMALINSKFVGNNPGHVIVVPLEHFENIYDLPKEIGCRILLVAKTVAVALKELRQCAGIMFQQNNEPASGQHAFHYHLHIFPRFDNDHLHEHMTNARVSKPEERKEYSQPLKDYFAKHPIPEA